MKEIINHLRHPAVTEILFKTAEDLNPNPVERDFQRVLAAHLRGYFGENLAVDLFGDIPTANAGRGYDLVLYSPRGTAFIEVKTDKNIKKGLRNSQSTKRDEVKGYSFLWFYILVFDTKDRKIYALE